MSHDAKKRSHVLLTLGILFTVGGAARFMPYTLATAEAGPSNLTTSAQKSTPEVGADVEPAGSPESLPDSASTSADEHQICFSGEIARNLADDQWLFDESEKAVREKQLALQAWQADLESQSAELEAMRETLENRWKEMQAASDSDLQHLAQMYGSMKPDQAASIFDQMDAGFAAGFLRLLPSDQAGLVLANMQPEKAYVVSVTLATLNDDIRRARDADTGLTNSN